jgi:hypothetical protein
MNLNKQKILAIATAALALAAALGSTILTPEQRDAIMQLLPTVLAVFGL